MNCLPGAICVMNVDHILHTLSSEDVDYLLIGGMNFLLRHLPELTFDVDIWVRDDSENLERLNGALRILSGEWGQTETDWRPVPEDWRWLRQQGCYCLTTTHGAVDISVDDFDRGALLCIVGRALPYAAVSVLRAARLADKPACAYGGN